MDKKNALIWHKSHIWSFFLKYFKMKQNRKKIDNILNWMTMKVKECHFLFFILASGCRVLKKTSKRSKLHAPLQNYDCNANKMCYGTQLYYRQIKKNAKNTIRKIYLQINNKKKYINRNSLLPNIFGLRKIRMLTMTTLVYDIMWSLHYK